MRHFVISFFFNNPKEKGASLKPSVEVWKKGGEYNYRFYKWLIFEVQVGYFQGYKP